MGSNSVAAIACQLYKKPWRKIVATAVGSSWSFPKANEKDIKEVPQEVRDDLTFIFVERIEEVLPSAFDQDVGNQARPTEHHASTAL